MASKREEFSVNTIIGSRSHVEGRVDSAGFTRVDGSLQGDLRAKGRVIIGDKARLKSGVSGTFVTISGVVAGNVIASERVIILSNAIVIGDVITRRIRADAGCIIHGKVQVCKSDQAWDEAMSRYRDAEIIKNRALKDMIIKSIEDAHAAS
jgi:cytoskeletal protein CcmA (bactofilin family)